MTHATLLSAALIALATPSLVEAPRILTLQGSSDASLPGAKDGTKHGVIVRRGSGFPDPIVIETPKVVVEDAPATPVRKKTKKKRRRGW
ncbi:MAG: hypothetical protein ABJF50_22480 [Paracoccaceae bacterium]